MNARKQGLLVLTTALALAILGVLLTAAGAGRVVRTVLAADRATVGMVFVVGLAWLVAWSTMLRRVLATLDVSLSRPRSFLIFSGAVFANNVTPFGQAGGEPVAAMIISKASDAPYETGLAGIASVDILNVIPSLSLIAVTVSFYGATASLGSRVELAVLSAFTIVGCSAILLAGTWTIRHHVRDRFSRLVARGAGLFGIESVHSLERRIADRLTRLIENLERVGTSRRDLAAALTFSLAGWLMQVLALSLAFAAVGYSVSPLVASFVIPLSYVAGAAPLPGGLGGIEAAMVALLIPTTGLAVSTITAAVLVFRGAIYWMPIAIGSAVVWGYGVRSVW